MEATMATATEEKTAVAAAGPVVEPAVMMQAAAKPETICGDCRYHIPRATASGSWCAMTTAGQYDQPVVPGQAACEDFATWPEGSPAPAFLAAMSF
jgi:hypothetical protein